MENMVERVTLSTTDVRRGKRYLVSRDLVDIGIFSKSVGVQFMTSKGYAKRETGYVLLSVARLFPDFVFED
jgi:hypothetical protein